jgi:hypothetical protein
MDGNVTMEGIKLDLEWMKRVGIGGMQQFDAALETPQRVSPRVFYMSLPWQGLFKFAAEQASRLDLEFSVAGSPGWSESGGPWVKPHEAMKKIVWSETRIEGAKRFKGSLPAPPSTIGPYQNIPIDRADVVSGGQTQASLPEFYRDIAVIAYKRPVAERPLAMLKPFVTTSAGQIDTRMLWDGDFARTIAIPFGAVGKPAWVQLEFSRAQTARALLLALPSGKGFESFEPKRIGELQSSWDGQVFNKVLDIERKLVNDPLQTLAFAPITARYFRVLLDTPAVQPTAPGLEAWTRRKTEHQLAELVLHRSARVNRAEDKAAFFVQPGLEQAPTPSAPAEAVVRKDEILDLTPKMHPDGSFEWAPRKGHWSVLRIGYSLLGITNHPASPEGTGLEVDKLSRAHVRSNYTHYLDQFKSVLGTDLIGARGLHGVINDSWEVGAQNWTEEMPAEFLKRRGYDLHHWLPALTGIVIDSSESTDRFLWDFRKTLAEMVAENHYAVIAEVLHERGMIHYAEAHEVGRMLIGDGMAVKRHSDIPMSAMWMPGGDIPQSYYDADIRESASVAHFYGQNVVAAESFTTDGGTYASTPEDLKPTADRELLNGLNRFVIHASVHQPLNESGPGFTLGPYGQWFTRHETWASQARPWIDYLSRNAYLLQQGRFVADVLYFYGEDSNITALYGAGLPPVPQGFNYDFANSDALNDLTVEDGDLISPGGARYRVLVLDPRIRVMSLSVVKRIHDLIAAGATVMGAKPLSTPSLADDPAEFAALRDALWSDNGQMRKPILGKGRLIEQGTLGQALAALGAEPDFSYANASPGRGIGFVHRRLDDGDLYFISNSNAHTERIEASFRVIGKAAELWHADTGHIESASYRFESGRTRVPLSLAPQEALFIVFRRATLLPREIPAPKRRLLITLGQSWQLRFPWQGATSFPTNWNRLQSWTESHEERIKYFSGTASYSRGLEVPASWLGKGNIELDLGSVKNLAEVLVNGRPMGIVWKAPFSVDITGALRAGRNHLEVKVTNLWPNRMIGDHQPGARRVTFATFDPFKADSPLLPSGLLGPVALWHSLCK